MKNETFKTSGRVLFIDEYKANWHTIIATINATPTYYAYKTCSFDIHDNL